MVYEELIFGKKKIKIFLPFFFSSGILVLPLRRLQRKKMLCQIRGLALH